MPFTPPSSDVTPPAPPPLPQPEKNWEGFRKRLFLLPVLFLGAAIPAGMAVYLVAWTFYEYTRAFAGTSMAYLAGGVVALLFSWGFFNYLVKPLALEKRQKKRWALIGTPLVLGAWVAVIAALMFTVCSGIKF